MSYGEITAQYVYDLRQNLGLEWLPKSVLCVLRFALLAQKKKLTSLPSFSCFERCDAEAVLTVAKYPVSFRDVLHDRAKVQDNAWTLVKALIEAHLKLEALGIVVKNIEPSSVFFTEDLKTA